MWIDEIALKYKDAQCTTKEIMHQPALWKKIWKQVSQEKERISQFLSKATSDCQSIILTGAGTSAYAGLTVQRSFRKNFGILAEPISTTHIVSHPEDFIIPSQNLMMVSFARSGNSPESCAAIDLANKHAKNVYHFIITCNKEGELAKGNENNENTYVFVLPEEANDKSLAMTSSFSGMVLAAILIARIDEIEDLESEVDRLCQFGDYCLGQSQYLWEVAGTDFDRAIFLGSGPLYGIAKESQLKMQELTDGLVICKHDSFLGLRHGPKAVINDKTLVVHHLTSNKHAQKYEKDLLVTMKESSNPSGQLVIGQDVEYGNSVDWVLNFKTNGNPLDEDLYSVLSIVPTQLLALFTSIQLGLKPDNPSRNGAISRVVKGVSIYHS